MFTGRVTRVRCHPLGKSRDSRTGLGRDSRTGQGRITTFSKSRASWSISLIWSVGMRMCLIIRRILQTRLGKSELRETAET